MAKRFTCTDKWKKPFLRNLDTPYKLLWFYILDDCDHSGVWQVDMEVAEIKVGEKFDIKKALENFEDKVIPFDNGEKWFIPDFIDFQYGKLNPANRAHESVLNLLDKYKNKGLLSPLERAKDKDKDKDMDMVKDISIIYANFKENLIKDFRWFDMFGMKYSLTPEEIPVVLDKFIEHLILSGTNHETIKDFQSHLKNWITSRREKIHKQHAR
jgi:hypothetical protein